MKFLCDNCKAKYQIADEKVAGKTVRMKCRKCGHQIEVRAAVTETSVSTSPPGAIAPNVEARSTSKGALATTLAAQKPRAPATHPGPSAGGALAGAFQRNVSEAPHATTPRANAGPVEVNVTDEWYVAINGVPVGPVRISELRRKAASGAVTDDSLCWQEGLEEWRPVRSVPELAALVREAANGNRTSFLPPATEGRPPTPPRAPQPPSPPAPRASAPQTPRPATPPFGPMPGALSPFPNGAPSGEPPHGQATVPLAPWPSYEQSPRAPVVEPIRAATPAPAPVAVTDPFGAPSGPVAVALAPETPRAKPGPPIWFLSLAVFLVPFGITAAYFMFRPTPPPQPPVVIQMPAAATAAPLPVKTEDIPLPPPSAEITPAASASTKVASNGPKNGTGGASAATTSSASGKGGGIDLGGLGPVGGGPNVGPAGAGAGSGGGLDSSSVERVVAAHRAGVKRTCWERGGADQKASVNVTITAQVGPGGNVVSTSSSGDDPVVAKCIESQVRSWMFSAPGSTTTVNIPFKFVRQ